MRCYQTPIPVQSTVFSKLYYLIGFHACQHFSRLSVASAIMVSYSRKIGLRTLVLNASNILVSSHQSIVGKYNRFLRKTRSH